MIFAFYFYSFAVARPKEASKVTCQIFHMLNISSNSNQLCNTYGYYTILPIFASKFFEASRRALNTSQTIQNYSPFIRKAHIYFNTSVAVFPFKVSEKKDDTHPFIHFLGLPAQYFFFMTLLWRC